MKGFWQRALNVFPQERRLVLRLSLVFLGLFLAVAFWRNYVDAAFIKRYGVQEMPLMLLINGLLTIIALRWLDRLGRRQDDVRLLAGFVVSYAVLVLGIYFLAGRGVAAAYAILFQLLYLQDSVLLVYLWNIASDRFDARQGRRLFPIFTGAQVLGTILGNFLTHPLRATADPDLSLIAFSTLWLGLGLYLASGTLGQVQSHAPGGSASQSIGLARIPDLVRTYPVVRFLLVLGLLPNLLLPIFTYQFSVIANQAFASEGALTSFLGLLRGCMSLAVFIMLALASRIYSRLGLANASQVQPICFSLVFAGLGLAFNIYLASIGQIVLRLVQQALAGPVNKVLFTLVPNDISQWCRLFVRGKVVKAGVIVSSLLMMLMTQAPAGVLTAVALVLSLWWVVETWFFRRRYQQGLKQAIASDLPDYDRLQPVSAGYHLADLETPQPSDSSLGHYHDEVMDPAQALPCLDDPELAVRVQAALTFARSPDLRAIHRLLILLDDQEVARRAAIEALAATGPAAQPLLCGALLAANPRVQRGILEVMRRAGLHEFDPLPFVGRQALAIYDHLAALAVLEGHGPSQSLSLLATHLQQVNQRSLGLIFQALWVKYADMRLMYSALRTAQAATAVELVESVLSPHLARYLVPLIDTIPLAAKVERGRRLLPVQQPILLSDALNQLAHARDALTRSLAAYAMGQHHPGPEWLPTVAALLFDEDQGVRWAATFAMRRCTGREDLRPEAIDQMDKLKDMEIFAGLSLAEIMAVVQLARKIPLAAGQTLLSPDHPATDLYLIVEGRVGLSRGAAAPGQPPSAVLQAGDILGAVGFFSQGIAGMTAVALEPGQALGIRGSELEEAMLLYPQIAVNLCRHLASRLRAADSGQA